MDKDEAGIILAEILSGMAATPWEELRGRLGEAQPRAFVGPSGVAYQVEITVVWDREEGGAIRVIASVDDGGWRALFPLTDSVLVKAASGG